jgi:hypothetical protein
MKKRPDPYVAVFLSNAMCDPARPSLRPTLALARLTPFSSALDSKEVCAMTTFSKCIQFLAVIFTALSFMGPSRLASANVVHSITGPTGSTADVDPTTGNGIIIPGFTNHEDFSGPPGKTTTRKTVFPDSLNNLPVTNVDGTFTDPNGNVSHFTDAVANNGNFVPLHSVVPPIAVSFPGLVATTGTTLYQAVDLSQVLANLPMFSLGETFTFTDGTSASLPGFLVGTSSVGFNSGSGFTTASPFTGTATAEFSFSIQSVPEPSTIIPALTAVSLGLLFALRRLRTGVKPKKGNRPARSRLECENTAWRTRRSTVRLTP